MTVRVTTIVWAAAVVAGVALASHDARTERPAEAATAAADEATAAADEATAAAGEARPAPRAGAEPAAEDGLFAYTLPRIDGTPQPLAAYRGRVLLLVNVASQCGFTPQYEGLEALYERYRERGFAVLGFPSNDFRNQEPGSNAEIAEFCRSTYGVRFPMFAKLHVKGDAAHPLFRYLTGLPEPVGGPVAWNFQKYLVSRGGDVVARFAPATTPRDPTLLARIEALLAEGA